MSGLRQDGQGPLVAGSVGHVPARHPNSARFHELLKKVGDLHDLKQRDYGRGDDPFANVRASEHFGVPGWVGAIMRAHDKMIRIQSHCLNGTLANESLEDSMLDMAVYAIIALVLREQYVAAPKETAAQNG